MLVINEFDLFNLFNLCIDVSATLLARMTPGFTGAEIKNLVNTAIC